MTTLSRRLTQHLSDWSPIAQHSCPHSQFREILIDNTSILHHENKKQKLQILEALSYQKKITADNKINYKV